MGDLFSVVERGFCCVMQAPSFVLLALVLCLAGVYASDACPRVYDGLTNAHFDLSTQFSVSEISGNWAGLSRAEVLGYEWAIISESKVTEKLTQDCRSHQGFVGLPDVLHWQNVGKESHATVSKLKLTPRTTYYIVLRTTLSNGVHVFSNSNGVLILPQELQLEGSHKVHAQPEPAQSTSSKRNLEQVVSECPIDQANRCAAAAVSPREILEELYGPPRFETPYLAFAVAGGGNDDDDDDDWNEAAAIVPAVIVGVILICLCCLLLLGLLAALLGKRGGQDKFTENVQTRQTEHVDASFGTTTEHTLADDTRVEFPDYDGTRLSVA